MNKVIVHKDRTNVITVDLGIDVSTDTLSSEIRSLPETDSALIATWVVAFETDGTNGMLVLTLDDLITAQIEVDSGYMDIKRITAGEPVPVFDKPLEVSFQGSVTA